MTNTLTHDERFLPNGRFLFDNGSAYVHSEVTCNIPGREDTPCVIHRPSKHHMRDWPMILRENALVERQCSHGVGHPDPDSLSYFVDMQPKGAWGVHGCDGCCRKDADRWADFAADIAKLNQATQPEARKIEAIRWMDSGKFYAHQWVSVDRIKEIADEWNGEVTTIGYVLYENDKLVVLVQTLDSENPNAAGAFAIYKPAIIERKVVS